MNEKDKNIYVIYEKTENGKFVNPVGFEWNGYNFDLSIMTKEEIFDKIKKIYPSIVDDFANGKVKRIDKVKTDVVTIVSPVEVEEKKNVKSVKNSKFRDLAKRTAAAVVAISILSGVLASCSKNKNNENNDNTISNSDTLEQDALETAKLVVENTMENFSKLAEKYAIDDKEYFISAEEWLSAYLYANSYELTVQELLQILDGNPNFYSKMSDNYRLFNEKMMTFNIISDEPALSKDFFENEECYNIYLNYFNTFKKAQEEPSKENKTALEELTKEIYGLTSIDENLESVYETHPDVASIIGHTLVVPGMMMNLITQETYDAAMGIYNYDKDGNLLETHGPIEWATCNDIEMEVFDRLETVVITSGVGTEDVLQPWFDELNKEYEVENMITTADALKYINELRFESFNNSIKYNSNNTTTITESNTSTVVVDPSTLTEAEKQEAQKEADKEFEQQYGEEDAKQEAYGAGMSDAMSSIETLLAKARQNEASANSISSSDITRIGNSLKNSYTGSYKDEYSQGVDVAVSHGISELASIKSQYKNFKDNSLNDEEIKEEIIETPSEEKEEQKPETPAEPEDEEEIIEQEELENGNNSISYEEEYSYEEEVIVEEEIITQEELEQETALVRVR